MSEWGWTPERNLGIWRHGAGWLKPVMAAVPFVTVGLLLLMLYFVSGTMASSRGVLFDLPVGAFTDAEKTSLVAYVMPMSRETTVFFDDSRYQLGDASSMRNFRESLVDSLSRSDDKTLLLMSDRRISAGNLMELMTMARECGVTKVFVAGRRNEESE